PAPAQSCAAPEGALRLQRPDQLLPAGGAGLPRREERRPAARHPDAAGAVRGRRAVRAVDGVGRPAARLVMNLGDLDRLRAPAGRAALADADALAPDEKSYLSCFARLSRRHDPE